MPPDRLVQDRPVPDRPIKGRPVILLTGFGPFPSVPANATTILVPRIAEAARRAFAGSTVVCHILPTEWTAGLAVVDDLYRNLRPQIALHFGVSGRATGFEIETRGRNRCHPSQDAAGMLPPLDRLSPIGPEYLPSPLPVAHIVERLRRRGIPAMISRDAGGYLCNALLYRTLDTTRRAADAPRVGFVHLPSSLVNERNPGRGPLPSCRLRWDDVITGGLEIIGACLGRPALPVAVLPRRVAYGVG